MDSTSTQPLQLSIITPLPVINQSDVVNPPNTSKQQASIDLATLCNPLEVVNQLNISRLQKRIPYNDKPVSAFELLTLQPVNSQTPPDNSQTPIANSQILQVNTLQLNNPQGDTVWPAYCDVRNCQVDILDEIPIVPISAYRSPMDTRKTVRSFEYVRRIIEANPTFTSIILSTRRSYTADACKRFSENTGLQYFSYLDDKSCTADHMIIQPESCHLDSKVRNIVIIDEIKSVLDQFNSPLHKDKLFQNRKVYDDYIINADYLLLLDADLDIHCLEFTHSLRPNDRIHLVNNVVQKRTDYTLEKTEDFGAFIQNMKDTQRYCFASTSYTLAKTLEGMLELGGSTHRFYSAQEDDRPDEIANLNTLVPTLNTLFYTGSLGSGVDINVEHFDTMFVFVHPKSNCARDVKQMIGRFRRLRNKRVVLLIAPQDGYKPDTRDAVIYYINNHLNISNNNAKDIIERFISPTDINRVAIQGKYRFFINHNRWTENYIQSTIEKNKSWNNMSGELLPLLINQGYILDQLPDISYDLSSRIYDEYKEAKEAYKQGRLLEWRRARIINDNVLKAEKSLIMNNQATKREKVEVHKRELIDKFILETPIEAIESISDDKKLQQRIYNCVCEIRYTDADLLTMDVNRVKDVGDSLFHHDKFRINKISVIRRVCAILGINNSFDTLTTINKECIVPYYNEIYHCYPEWKRIFNFRGKRPDQGSTNYSDYIAVIRSVIKSWSGHNLKRKNSENQSFYLTCPIPHFSLLVENYKYYAVSGPLNILVENIVTDNLPPGVEQPAPMKLIYPSLLPQPKNLTLNVINHHTRT